MAKPTKAEPKVELEREYVVPLRKGWLKVPTHKRANKAMKTLKEFIAQHMKVYDRDLRKIKVDNILNNEMRFRGMRKPLAKIRVKAIKLDTGIVRVELVDIPTHVRFAKLREEKKKAELEKKTKNIAPVKTEAKPEESEETKEKEAASRDEGLKLAKEEAKEQKHVSSENKNIEKMTNERKRSQAR